MNPWTTKNIRLFSLLVHGLFDTPEVNENTSSQVIHSAFKSLRQLAVCTKRNDSFLDGDPEKEFGLLADTFRRDGVRFVL